MARPNCERRTHVKASPMRVGQEQGLLVINVRMSAENEAY